MYTISARITVGALLLIALLLTGCAIAKAQDNFDPNPPTNVRLSAGLEYPERPKTDDRGPWVEMTFDMSPPPSSENIEKVRSRIVIDIERQDGARRPGGINDFSAIYIASVDYFRGAGCTYEDSDIPGEGWIIRITSDCFDRWKSYIWGWGNPFNRGYLKPGMRYEIRIGVEYSYWKIRDDGTKYYRNEYPVFTPVQSITIPDSPIPTLPTPTPLPTPAPAPTSIPEPEPTLTDIQAQLSAIMEEIQLIRRVLQNQDTE